MNSKTKTLFNLEKRVDNLFLVAWFSLIVSAVAMIAFFTHYCGQPDEKLNVIEVDGIEQAPYDVKSYICTSGVQVEDFREGCKPYRCELWFKGKGECAYE